MQHWTPLFLISLLVSCAYLNNSYAYNGSDLRSKEEHFNSGHGVPEIEHDRIVNEQQLLERVHEKFQGKVLKLAFDYEHQFYKVKLLTPQGHVLLLFYDAGQMAFLDVKGQHDHSRREKDD